MRHVTLLREPDYRNLGGTAEFSSLAFCRGFFNVRMHLLHMGIYCTWVTKGRMLKNHIREEMVKDNEREVKSNQGRSAQTD